MNTLKTTIGVIALILVLGSLGACLDGPEDHQGDWSQSDNLKALQDSEAGTARREAAAQALCREAHGESVALWTVEGHLVCRPRRAVLKAQVQL
ncbi:hypothetical protein [Polaromonas sp.]|uniref:hypothetical protein n=1 Tax=Polaromonas sp. TaxID=1869339 RepID=UPI0037510D35